MGTEGRSDMDAKGYNDSVVYLGRSSAAAFIDEVRNKRNAVAIVYLAFPTSEDSNLAFSNAAPIFKLLSMVSG